MKKTIFLLIAIATLVSCKEAVKKEPRKPVVKLYALEGGSIFVKKLEVFSQDTTYTGQTKQFTDAYYVISHPKGNLMWDAGLPEQLVVPEPYDEPSGVFAIQRPDSLVNQLASIGFKIDDFKYFAMSHSHFDHIGGLDELRAFNFAQRKDMPVYAYDASINFKFWIKRTLAEIIKNPFNLYPLKKFVSVCEIS